MTDCNNTVMTSSLPNLDTTKSELDKLSDRLGKLKPLLNSGHHHTAVNVSKLSLAQFIREFANFLPQRLNQRECVFDKDHFDFHPIRIHISLFVHHIFICTSFFSSDMYIIYSKVVTRVNTIFIALYLPFF